MQTTILLTVLLGLSACGFASKPDPRVFTIRQQHQQLLAKQKAVVSTEDEADIARAGFAQLVKQSNNIQLALDQLDQGNSQEAAQVELVTNLASQEATLLEQANLIERMTHRSTPSRGVTDGSTASESSTQMGSVNAEMDTVRWSN